MRILDIIVLSFRQFKERRLRSVLTLLAIAVGVTSIIALSAQVEGVKGEITKSLETLGPNSIIVTVGESTQLFTDADVSRLKSLEGVNSVTPVLFMNARVTGIKDPVNLVGVSSTEIVSLLGEVRLLDGDVYYDVPAPQALVGYNVAIDEVGEARYKVGQPILVQIGTKPIVMNVVGVLDAYGVSLMIQAENSVFIPIDYIKTFSRSGGYTMIIVEAGGTESVDQITDLVGYVFGGRGNVMSVKQITNTVISITSQINLLLMGIAGTAFIAAGLGTFNIMMISVLERVREIGILKSLGMKDKGVLTLYITQGVLLGVFGSLTGLGLGAIMAHALPIILAGGFGQGMPEQNSGAGPGGGAGMGPASNMMSSYTPVISLNYLVIAVSVSIVVTLLSTAYPAWKASRLNPVDALRNE